MSMRAVYVNFDITAAARRRFDDQIARHRERLSTSEPDWRTIESRHVVGVGRVLVL
jgi:hypothetical protein